jgi:hypothetical protein
MFPWRRTRSFTSLSELSRIGRFASRVHYGVIERAIQDADAVAHQFGLDALGEDWRKVDRDTANLALVKLLVEDMAYNKRRLSDAQAEALAAEFLAQFSPQASFHTNGNWELDPVYATDGSGVGHAWVPATSATFDGGVIALDEKKAGVLWIEDED